MTHDIQLTDDVPLLNIWSLLMALALEYLSILLSIVPSLLLLDLAFSCLRGPANYGQVFYFCLKL